MALEKKWYVIRVANGKENKIKSAVFQELQRMGYADHIEDALVPMEKVSEIKNGKKVVKEVVKMTGYVFLKIDLSGEMVHIIRNMQGVSGFLGETRGGDPCPLKKYEVESMIGSIEQENIDVVNIPFEVGDKIRVMEGTFENFDGEVEEIYPEKRSLSVCVKMFGKPTTIELEYTEVEKI